MNAEQAAWDKWRGSEEGKRCLDAKTLGDLQAKDAQFLQNRIWKAYTNGVNAGEQIAIDRIARQQRKQVEEVVRSPTHD